MWQLVGSAGTVQAAMQVVNAEELKAAVSRAAKPFQGDNGEILLNNRFRYVTAAA